MNEEKYNTCDMNMVYAIAVVRTSSVIAAYAASDANSLRCGGPCTPDPSFEHIPLPHTLFYGTENMSSYHHHLISKKSVKMTNR